MAGDRKRNHRAMTPDTVQVTVRFITIMQKYSDSGKREVEMELPREPDQAVDHIINRFHIPWKDNLEKYTRIFINGVVYDSFVESETHLKAGDTIAFIPMSGGG
jgi:molybdopterin converting factor small subunit